MGKIDKCLNRTKQSVTHVHKSYHVLYILHMHNSEQHLRNIKEMKRMVTAFFCGKHMIPIK